MRYTIRLGALILLLTGCAGQSSNPAPVPTAKPTVIDQALPNKPTQPTRYDGPGHNYANAIQFPGVTNPLAFSQQQQEWLWLNYRDWKKQGQALREKDGAQYDEVTLVNKWGETRVLYFRMPAKAKPQ